MNISMFSMEAEHVCETHEKGGAQFLWKPAGTQDNVRLLVEYLCQFQVGPKRQVVLRIRPPDMVVYARWMNRKSLE